MISDTAASSYTLCLLIDQVDHMTLLLPQLLKSCHAGGAGLSDCVALGFRSYLHGPTPHRWQGVGPRGPCKVFS
jgi:hypothetical protein